MVLPPPNEARGVGDGPSELIDLKVRWLEQFNNSSNSSSTWSGGVRRHEGRVGCGRVGGGPREARGVGPRQAHGARRDPARGPAAARRDAAVRGADAADSSGSVRGPGDRVPEVLLKQNFVLENIQGQKFQFQN